MKKKKVFSSAVCMLAICSILSAAGCSNGKAKSDKANTDLASVLDALGVSTSVEERTDPNGKVLRSDYNPMGKKTTRINKVSEIYVAGAGRSGDVADSLIEPADDSLITSDPDGAWAKSAYFKTVGADTDGNGHDEIVTAVFDITSHKLVLKETKYGISYSRKDVASIDDAQITDSNAIGDIAAGDIDGDGKEEILVTYLSNLIIFDDAANGYRQFANTKIPSITAGTQLLKVKTGDFDQDGKDEFVVTNGTLNPSNTTTAQYTIYDDIISDPTLSDPIESSKPLSANYTTQIINYGGSSPVTGVTKSLEAANIAVGDFNGDGLPDIAFAGNTKEDSGSFLFILKTSMDKDSKPKFEFLQTTAGDSSYENAAPPVAAGDINGDGKDEIVMWTGVYSLSATNLLSVVGTIIPAAGTPILEIKVGDTDGDHKAEIVMLYGLGQILIYDYDSASKITQSKSISITNKNTLAWGTITLPSTRKTSEVIEFTGHDVKFTDPRIIAVIAAPPYYKSLDGRGRDEVQPYLGNIGTSFGKSSSAGSENSNTFGFSVSFSWGSSVDCPLWGSAASAEMKTTLSNSFDWTSTNSKEITYACSYTNGTDDDMVVFSVIPFDVYSYKVLNSYDPNLIGQTVTISLPKKPITTSLSVSFYNDNNGDYFDVGKSVLKHAIGEPFSYSTSDDMAAIKKDKPNGLYIPTSYEQTVGEGTSATTLSMQSAETKSKNFSYNLSLTNEMQAVAVGLLVGREIGFNYGYSYSTSVTNATEIEGQVANLSSSHYRTDRRFTWGIMAYPYTDSDSKQSFNVITYWVDKL